VSSRYSGWLVVAALLAFSGCSSLTDEGSTQQGLSADQADWIAGLVADVGTHGLNAGATSAPPVTPTADGPQPVLLNQSVNYRYQCSVSGAINVLGNLSGSINDDTGSGVLLIGVTETLTNCRHSTTSGGWFEVNGDPYLSLAGTFSFLNWAPATQQTITIGGAIRWAFDTGQSGSCQVQLTILMNSAAGTGTISGTVCGYGISRSF
jgi:hypothetical protein